MINFTEAVQEKYEVNGEMPDAAEGEMHLVVDLKADGSISLNCVANTTILDVAKVLASIALDLDFGIAEMFLVISLIRENSGEGLPLKETEANTITIPKMDICNNYGDDNE